MELHGGSVSLVSTKDAGTTVLLKLPASRIVG
jgi:signal transduction histidine kinase